MPALIAAETETPLAYREALRSIESFAEDTSWFEVFADDAVPVLVTKSVSLRTMKILAAMVSAEVLPSDPRAAAEVYCRTAVRAEEMLRRGENPTRIVLTSRQRLQDETGAVPGSQQQNTNSAHRDEYRRARAKKAIKKAQENKSENDPPGQGPKKG
jgi:hypothetical protein